MSTTRNPFRRNALALAAILVLAAPTESALGANSCTWTPSTGDWSTAGNWSCNAVPKGPNQDSATIAGGKTVSITSAQSIFTLANAGTIDIDAFTLTLQGGGSTTNSGTINVGTPSVTGSLLVSNDILNTGGTIHLANGSFLDQFSSAITGGTIGTTGTGAIVAFSNGNNVLSGVTLNGLLDATTTANARERIANGMALNGSINIGNGGIVSLDSTLGATNTLTGTGTITLGDSGARLAIEGSGTTTLGAGITVQGQGNIGSALFSAGNNTLVNDGHILANVAGGTLSISAPANSGSVTNHGTMQASNGGTLALQTSIANGGGTISALAGSVAEQDSITITGGAISTAGTGVLRASSSGSNFLDGVAITGTLDLATIANSRERIVNGATINGAVNVSNGGILTFDSAGTTGGAQTLAGTVSINLNDAGARIAIDGAGTTTLGSGVTIHGQGNIGSPAFTAGNNTLTNNGLISSDVSGGSLEITAPGNSGSFVNNGTLQAINGGKLVLSTNIQANAGSHIVSGAGSTVLQNGVTINGSFTSSGGGLFTASSSSGNILDNVDFTGNLDASSVTNARERIGNNLALAGTVNIGNGGIVSLDSTLGAANAISGHATFNLSDGSASLAVEGSGTTTLGADVIVHGQGSFGQATFSAGNNVLTNNGLVSADVSGAQLNIVRPANSGSFVNNGTLQATGGGQLVLSTDIQSNTGSIIQAATGSSVLQSNAALNGAITTTGTGFFAMTSSGANVLNAVTFNGTMDTTAGSASRERIGNGFTLNGVVNIADDAVVSLDSTQGATNAITGTGNFALNGAGAWLSIEGTGATTLGSGIVVHGQGHFGQAAFNAGNNVLTNNGRISADVSGGTLTLQVPANSGSFINNGLVDARNASTLVLSTNVANASGTIGAQNGSTVVQNGVTISGGAITNAGTGALAVTSSGGNFLDGVTVTGLVDMSGTNDSRERVINGLTLNGVVNIANDGILSLDSAEFAGGVQSIQGNASINLNDASAQVSVEGNGTTTLGSGVVIHGQGSVGQALFTAGSNNLVNNGRISADVSGGTLRLATPGNAGILTNANLIDARNGGTLMISTNVANTGGTIGAQTGSTVIQDGVTITGGTISTAGTGTLRVTSDGNNVLTGVTLAGTADMTTVANARERIVGGTTVNGAINVANGGILTFDSTGTANQTIGGTGTINLNDAAARISIDGAGVTTLGSGLTVRGQGNIGTALFSAGNNVLTNNGLILANVSGGTLTISQPANAGSLAGTGTLQADGGTLSLDTNGTATQGRLVVGAAGSQVKLNGNTLVVTNDYTNAQSGSGNTFDRHAGVTTGAGGAINAGGNATQAITGLAVSNGGTTNATLTIGNVRVGTTTYDYQVANTGTSGPSLRGALQTSVNGANISDTRLGGSGVTAGNYNTGAPGGNTGDLGVTFTVATAGNLAPLTGQSINLRSNFDNIADQRLNIVLGSNAAAYQAAAGQIQTPALNFGTVQVGQAVSQNLVVRNIATGASGFVEDLNASFGGTTGTGASLISGTGSLNGIRAGTNSTGANGGMTVSVNTTQAGAVNGGITVNYQTAGAVNGVSNGLGVASVGSESYGVAGTIQATATVVNAASPVVNNPTISFGAHRVGDAAPIAKVSVTNAATAAPQAALNATITSNGAPVTASGSFNLLDPGATNASALTVGLNTNVAGNFTGANAKTATIGFVSDASNIGNCGSNCQMTLASQQVSITGKVYTTAVAQANTTSIDFGIVHVGDTVGARGVSVTNSAPSTALNDVLRGSLGGATGPFTASGSFSALAAQATDASSLLAGLDTTNSGVFNSSVTATFASHDADLADVSAGSAQVTLSGQVNNYASAALEETGGPVNLAHAGSTYTLDFGTLLQGSADLTDTLAVLNSATGLADLLGGTFSPTSVPAGFDLSGFGAFSGLGAGQSAGGLTVTFDTSATGAFDDVITLHSSGSNASGYNGALGDITLQLEGVVTGQTAAVPEPASNAMFFAGLAALLGLKRWRGQRESRRVDESE